METQTEVPAKPRATPPILVIAAIAVVIFSATGTAAIMGWLPASSGSTSDSTAAATQPEPASATSGTGDKASAKVTAEAAPASTSTGKANPLQVAAAPVKLVCNDCGVIESVREIKQRGDGSGLGAVGGAVVGGIVGHQFGGGDGKKITTAAGVIGGALAGHQIEKEVKATKSYEITVRLDDGSKKVVNSANVPGWQTGDKVKVVDGEIRAI